MTRLRIYLAGQLYAAGHRQHLELMAAILEETHSVYLPHRDGGLYTALLGRDRDADKAARTVWTSDLNALDKCDVLLAITHGRFVADPGVCMEIGYAVARGVPCVAYGPDMDVGPSMNPMIRASLAAVLTELSQLTNFPSNANLSKEQRA